MAESITRTTLALPSEVLKKVDQAVRAGKARSRNAYVTAALRRDLAALEAAEIDAAFALMAEDSDYQAESDRMAKEFEIADWEAFQLGESKQ